MSSATKISRRKFIFLALLGLIGAAITSFLISSFNKVVYKVLSKDLSHLNVSFESYAQFIKEAQENNHWNKKFFDEKKRLFFRAYYLLDYLPVPLPYKYKYVQYRSEIVGDFLLSTDFFINKMDVNKEIAFLGLYNPYKRPCSNPFSNLYYPEG